MSRHIEELVRAICGGDGHPLAPTLRAWAEDSRPWLAFAGAHASKIRKKVRLVSSEDELGDLLAELAVAALLVRDRRFSVVYEPYRASGRRGPDLGVTFRTHTPFQVEVTRLRLSGETGAEEAARRLARVLGDKIGQFLPGSANLLAVVLPTGAARDDLIPAAVRLLSRPTGEGATSPTPGLPPGSVRAYAQGQPRLSAALLCALKSGGQPADVRLWLNPQARHPLAPEVVRSLLGATQ